MTQKNFDDWSKLNSLESYIRRIYFLRSKADAMEMYLKDPDHTHIANIRRLADKYTLEAANKHPKAQILIPESLGKLGEKSLNDVLEKANGQS